MNLTNFDKAIAAGIVSAIVAWLSRYGWTLSPVVHDALASVSLAVVSYLAAHVTVYMAKNKGTNS